MDYDTGFYPSSSVQSLGGAGGGYGSLPYPSSSTTSGLPNDDSFGSVSPPPYGTFDAFAHFEHGRELPGLHQQGMMTPGVADLNMLMEEERESSLEKEMNNTDDKPVMQRRKAQNRAAQRAFRERKERHVKELEGKLTNLEASASTVTAENERLKLQLQKISTENQILRATSSHAVQQQKQLLLQQQRHNSMTSPPLPANTELGPSSWTPYDFFTTLLAPHADKTPNHRVVRSPVSGERLLGAGAAWDMITTDPLYVDGMVDIEAVCERIKPLAKCDGRGPVFEQSAIRTAIQLSLREDKDELI